MSAPVVETAAERQRRSMRLSMCWRATSRAESTWNACRCPSATARPTSPDCQRSRARSRACAALVEATASARSCGRVRLRRRADLRPRGTRAARTRRARGLRRRASAGDLRAARAVSALAEQVGAEAPDAEVGVQEVFEVDAPCADVRGQRERRIKRRVRGVDPAAGGGRATLGCAQVRASLQELAREPGRRLVAAGDRVGERKAAARVAADERVELLLRALQQVTRCAALASALARLVAARCTSSAGRTPRRKRSARPPTSARTLRRSPRRARIAGVLYAAYHAADLRRRPAAPLDVVHRGLLVCQRRGVGAAELPPDVEPQRTPTESPHVNVGRAVQPRRRRESRGIGGAGGRTAGRVQAGSSGAPAITRLALRLPRWRSTRARRGCWRGPGPPAHRVAGRRTHVTSRCGARRLPAPPALQAVTLSTSMASRTVAGGSAAQAA